MPSIKPIILDGSTLEGGGQLVRVALSLSAITSTPIMVTNIRANRAPKGRPSKSQSRPSKTRPPAKLDGGLKESHLAAVLYLAQKCNAYVQGAEVGSRELTFIPYTSIANAASATTNRPIELQNPGSVCLILQALVPYLLLQTSEKVEVILRGGTNVSKSMSADYVQLVLMPTLAKIGIEMTVEIIKRGWAGNSLQIGEILCKITPVQNIPDFSFTDQGDVSKMVVKIIAGDDSTKQDFVTCLSDLVPQHFSEDTEIEILDVEDSGDPRRIYVLLIAETDQGWRLGRDFLGTGKTFRKDSERAAMCQSACETLVRQLKSEIKRGGCVDEFMQDQLVIFQTLAGKSVVDGGPWKENHGSELGDETGSLHTRTVRWVCEKMLKSKVRFEHGGVCHGIGWQSAKP